MISLSHSTIFLKSSKRLAFIMVCAIAIGLVGCSQQTINSKASNDNEHSRRAFHDKLSNVELKSYQQAITGLNESDFNVARTLLQKLSKTRPKLAEIHFNLALAHYKLNELETAESSLDQALKINPDNPQALVLKGVIETKNGNINQAEYLYKKALGLNQNYVNAHYNLALLYDIFYQDIPLAARHYQRYLELTDYKDKQTVVWLEEINSSFNLDSQRNQDNPRKPLAQLD